MLKLLNLKWEFVNQAKRRCYLIWAPGEKSLGVSLECSYDYKSDIKKGSPNLDWTPSRIEKGKNRIILHRVDNKIFDKRIMLIRVWDGFTPAARGAEVFRLNQSRKDILVVQFNHPAGYLASWLGHGFSGRVVTWDDGIKQVDNLSTYKEKWEQAKQQGVNGVHHSSQNGNGCPRDRRIPQLAKR